jgi:hypothetical protein
LERELEVIETSRIEELPGIENGLREGKEAILREEEERYLRNECDKPKAMKGTNWLVENLLGQNDELRFEHDLLLQELQEEERVARRLHAESLVYEEMIGKAKKCTTEMEGSLHDLANLIPQFDQNASELEDEVHFYQELGQVEYRSKVLVREVTSTILDRLSANVGTSKSIFAEFGLTAEAFDGASPHKDSSICQSAARSD